MPSKYTVPNSRAAAILCVEIATDSRGKTFGTPDTPRLHSSLYLCCYIHWKLALTVARWTGIGMLAMFTKGYHIITNLPHQSPPRTFGRAGVSPSKI